MKPHKPLAPMSREALERLLARRGPIMAEHVPSRPYGIADRFEERAASHADHIFLIDGDRRLTYGEVERESRRYAYAADALGLVRGDVCAFMFENRIEYVTVMLGLIRRGVVVALLNTSARGQALQHMLSTTDAKVVVIGGECAAAFEPGLTELPLYGIRDGDGSLPTHVRDLAPLAPADPGAIDPAWRAGLVCEDWAMMIFTSGTTGLPKAGLLSHMRWLVGGDIKAAMMELDEDDVFYCFLPMFHGAVMMSLFASCMAVGGAFLIRRRFSASRFWEDVRREGVTVCQYVGEVCRYLLNRPPQPDDRDHSLRALTGTSMSAEMWPLFQARFGIPQIYEGWGSTECNTSLVNYENIPGSVGRVPDWSRTNLRIVRYDIETGTHPRDADGHLILCGPDEPGEAIAKITRSPTTGAGRFEGYTSPAETERKILRDCFGTGDEYWSSGDLLRADADDYVWFVDRIGDTFRWKSENVSTQEVADLLSDFPGLEMIVIYGVTVPGQEGRAGMSALILQDGATFDPAAFHALATKRLASYAVPLFVRIWQRPDFTASYKLRKVDLQREAYDPTRVTDPLYVIDVDARTYAPLTDASLARAGLPPSQ